MKTHSIHLLQLTLIVLVLATAAQLDSAAADSIDSSSTGDAGTSSTSTAMIESGISGGTGTDLSSTLSSTGISNHDASSSSTGVAPLTFPRFVRYPWTADSTCSGVHPSEEYSIPICVPTSYGSRGYTTYWYAPNLVMERGYTNPDCPPDRSGYFLWHADGTCRWYQIAYASSVIQSQPSESELAVTINLLVYQSSDCSDEPLSTLADAPLFYCMHDDYGYHYLTCTKSSDGTAPILRRSYFRPSEAMSSLCVGDFARFDTFFADGTCRSSDRFMGYRAICAKAIYLSAAIPPHLYLNQLLTITFIISFPPTTEVILTVSVEVDGITSNSTMAFTNMTNTGAIHLTSPTSIGSGSMTVSFSATGPDSGDYVLPPTAVIGLLLANITISPFPALTYTNQLVSFTIDLDDEPSSTLDLGLIASNGTLTSDILTFHVGERSLTFSLLAPPTPMTGLTITPTIMTTAGSDYAHFNPPIGVSGNILSQANITVSDVPSSIYTNQIIILSVILSESPTTALTITLSVINGGSLNTTTLTFNGDETVQFVSFLTPSSSMTAGITSTLQTAIGSDFAHYSPPSPVNFNVASQADISVSGIPTRVLTNDILRLALVLTESTLLPLNVVLSVSSGTLNITSINFNVGESIQCFELSASNIPTTMNITLTIAIIEGTDYAHYNHPAIVSITVFEPTISSSSSTGASTDISSSTGTIHSSSSVSVSTVIASSIPSVDTGVTGGSTTIDSSTTSSSGLSPPLSAISSSASDTASSAPTGSLSSTTQAHYDSSSSSTARSAAENDPSVSAAAEVTIVHPLVSISLWVIHLILVLLSLQNL